MISAKSLKANKILLVIVAIVGGSKFSKDKVDSREGEDDVNDFHASVVDRNVGGKQVQVTGKEDDEEEELRK